ncbi:MAG: Sulfate permease [uncultured Solirubrobacteraceae bacterium]|uniref:Sulfate permease n=1 Tax=uncultured Solirubrobacteraceae bacterium TaxID=1162706 RepID=A0A6J4RUC3_9ACTN|nr:MAG: Sulfate permease [uncultured Solirubrobacteraceae bacterium]
MAGLSLRRPARGDVIAGISVALVLIPQSLAYAELAGMPPERGLYAATIALIVAAPLASSPYLQTGPVALTSVLTFSALSALAEPRGTEYVELGLLLALVVGVIRLGVGLLRAGALAYLMSRPMLLGFVPAAATFIAASQLPAATGAPAPAGEVLTRAAWTLAHPGAWQAPAVVLAVFTLVTVFAARRAHPLFPGVLVAVAVAGAASLLLGYDGARIGALDVGLPPITAALPWSSTLDLLLPGAIIALVGFAEPAAIARSFASRDRAHWDSNREFVSQGAASVAAAFTGGFPVGGSFSRSSLNRLVGARTAWSGAITGVAVLALLPATFLLAPVPTAVLAAIVIVAVVPLMTLFPVAALWRDSRPATLIAVGTFAATLTMAPHIERGVLVGIGLSVVVHLWRELHIDVDAWEEDGTLHLRPQGVLWFAAVQAFEDALLAALARHPRADAVLIHLDGLGRLDITAATTLRDLIDQTRSAGIGVGIADVRPRDRRLVDGIILRAAGPPL